MTKLNTLSKLLSLFFHITIIAAPTDAIDKNIETLNAQIKTATDAYKTKKSELDIVTNNQNKHINTTLSTRGLSQETARKKAKELQPTIDNLKTQTSTLEIEKNELEKVLERKKIAREVIYYM